VGSLVTHPGTRRKARMKALKFDERRNEICWRLHAHGRRLQHVAALTASVASTELQQAVVVSSRALQRTRSAWVQADEAQDALYFFHAQLFPARAPPHDVYGAIDVQLAGRWFDLPTDLHLLVDRYQQSKEASWSKAEVDARWNMTVRRKLLLGELGRTAALRKKYCSKGTQCNGLDGNHDEDDGLCCPGVSHYEVESFG
jgi:hypothetical protein